MKTITLKSNKIHKYRTGYVCLEKADVESFQNMQEGELFLLVTPEQEVLGTFYFGIQNKGIGWKVSDQKINALDVTYFQELFDNALNERKSLYQSSETNAFRLFNESGDHFGGLTIDNYDGHLLLTFYSKGVYQYQSIILEAVKRIFEYKTIYEKLRFEHDVPTHCLSETEADFPIMIEEHQLFYSIDFTEGPMTGLFLDQREVRKKLRRLNYPGKQMLNLFAYSGGFSLNCADIGMKTTNVDIANRSIELMKTNFGINSLDVEEQSYFTLDAFDALKYFKRHNKVFDCIVIDPPSFSRNKKKVFSVKENYDELIINSLPILKRNGYLVLSTNASNYSLKSFKSMIEATLKHTDYEIEAVMGLPKDFKTTDKYKPSKYLKVIFIRVG